MKKYITVSSVMMISAGLPLLNACSKHHDDAGPAGPAGPVGPVGPVGPTGPSGSGAMVGNFTYTCTTNPNVQNCTTTNCALITIPSCNADDTINCFAAQLTTDSSRVDPVFGYSGQCNNGSLNLTIIPTSGANFVFGPGEVIYVTCVDNTVGAVLQTTTPAAQCT